MLKRSNHCRPVVRRGVLRAPPTFETARYSLTVSELGGWGPASHAMVCGRARVWMITAEGRLQRLVVLAHLIGPILLSGSHSRCTPRNLFAVANQHLALEHERPVGRGRQFSFSLSSLAYPCREIHSCVFRPPLSFPGVGSRFVLFFLSDHLGLAIGIFEVFIFYTTSLALNIKRHRRMSTITPWHPRVRHRP